MPQTPINPAEVAQNIKKMTEMLPAVLDIMRLDAAKHRAKYLALIREGFTQEQALELCKDVRF